MSAFFSTFTEIGLVDTRLNPGVILLPKTTEIPYRIITLKDIYGKFATNALTLMTQTGESFEDGTTTKIFRNDGTFISLYAGTAMAKWYIMGGTQTLSQTISSLTVSTITGDGGYLRNLNAISSLTLFSSLQGLGSLGYLSSAVTNLSSIISTPQLVSSLEGLGTLGYISSAHLTSSLQAISQVFKSLSVYISSLTAVSLNVSTTGFISSLTVNALIIGDGTGHLYMGDIVTTSLSTLIIYSGVINGTQIIASTLQGDGSKIVNAPYVSSSQLISSLQGLGTLGYLSSSTGLSGTVYLSSIISTPQLTSTIEGLGTLGYLSSSTGLSGTVYLSSIISTPQLTSTIQGLGTLGYISSASGTTVVPPHFVSTLSLYSSIEGLGTLGYISSALTNSVNVNVQSTFFIDSQYLISQPSYGTFTVHTGFSYIGAPWASQIVQLQSVVNSFSQVELSTDNQTLIYTGAQAQYFRITYTCGGNQNEVAISRPTLTMQVTSQGVTKTYQTVNNIESAGASVTNVIQLNPNDHFIFLTRGLENYTFATIDTTYYEIIVETIVPLAINTFSTLGVSSLSIINQVTGKYASIILSNYIYVDGVQVSIQNSDLTSSINSLGEIGYISTIQLVSTTKGIENYISSLIKPTSYEIFTVQSGFSYIGAPWTSQIAQLQHVTTNYSQIQLYVDNQTIVYKGVETQYFRITYTCGGNQNEVAISRPTLTMQVTSQGITKTYQTVNNIESAGGSLTNVIELSQNDQIVFLIRGLENYTFAAVDTGYYQITVETVGTSLPSLANQTTAAPTSISTVVGLGSLGYISTSQLVSTTQALLAISSFSSTFTSSIQVNTLQLQAPLSSAYVRQPFFQYGNTIFTGLTLNGGISTITLPLSYSASNSYFPFVQSANSTTTTIVTAYTSTTNQFIVQWSTLTGANTVQTFNWNTMGT